MGLAQACPNYDAGLAISTLACRVILQYCIISTAFQITQCVTGPELAHAYEYSHSIGKSIWGGGGGGTKRVFAVTNSCINISTLSPDCDPASCVCPFLGLYYPSVYAYVCLYSYMKCIHV